MGNLQQWISNQMEELRLQLQIDFISLAVYDIMTDEIRWRIAVGASNSRYKRIVIRLGKGIAGEVVQLNRSIKVEHFPNDVAGDPIEYPIILTEHLKSALAIPVSYENKIFGVLLLGHRQLFSFTERDESKASDIAQQIAKEMDRATNKNRSTNTDTKDGTPISINNTLFVKYLKNSKTELLRNKRGEINFELLDQSFIEIPEEIQQVIIDNMEEFLNIIHTTDSAHTSISIVRDEGLILIDSISTFVNNPIKQLFENIYKRMGQIGGSIVSYQEKDRLHFVMQIPIWVYRDPLSGY